MEIGIKIFNRNDHSYISQLCVISFRILFGLQIELTLDLNEMKANALIMDLLYLNIIGAGIYFPGDFFLNFLKK